MSNDTKKTTVQNSAIEPRKENVYEEFVFWYALPASERAKTGIDSMTDFAEKHNVHRNTLGAWKADIAFSDRVGQLRKQWGQEMTAHVFDGWRLACMKGNPQAIELWLSYFEGWDKKQVVEQRKVVEVTANDIRTLINELPANEQKEFYGILANLADRVRYYRSIRQVVHSAGDGAGERAELEPPREVQRKTYHLPQGTSDGRADAMATGNQEHLRSTVAR